jgi:hypothetical protein
MKISFLSEKKRNGNIWSCVMWQGGVWRSCDDISLQTNPHIALKYPKPFFYFWAFDFQKPFLVVIQI